MRNMSYIIDLPIKAPLADQKKSCKGQFPLPPPPPPLSLPSSPPRREDAQKRRKSKSGTDRIKKSKI